MFINLLPLTVGRNILEISLIDKKEIFGYSLFDVKYFVPIYLSDLFLLLIYQNYFSKKFFNKNKKQNNELISPHFKYSLASLIIFLIFILIRSINHEFSSLLILGSLTIVKYILIFAMSQILNFIKDKDKKLIYQSIASVSFFQTVVIFIEQFKGGSLGSFIETKLPGREVGFRETGFITLLRADGTFNEPNIAATFLLMNGILLIDYGLKQLKTKNNNYLYSIIGALSLSAIIFTGSRSLYALTFLCLVFYFIKYRKKILILSKKLFKQKILKMIGLIIMIISLPYLIIRINAIKEIFSNNGSLAYRLELNRNVLLMSTNNSFGIGLDMTSYYIASKIKTVDNQSVIFDQAPAHNILIQIFTETGFYAFLIFLFFVYYSLRSGLTKKNNGFALAALAYFLAAQFHPVFTNQYGLTAFFFLYLGLSLNEKS